MNRFIRFITVCMALGLAGQALAQDKAADQTQPASSGTTSNGTASRVSLIGEFRIPTGLTIDGIPFGGISDLDYDPHSGYFYAMSDDRSEFAPARFYKLRLDLTARGIRGLDIAASIPLRDAKGGLFPAKSIDPEGISLNPVTGLMAWSSEGDSEGRPSIHEASIDGYQRRSFDIPGYYMPNADRTMGILNNLAFEGLSYAPDGSLLFAALENGLGQDGGSATLKEGSLSRILVLDPVSGTPTAEYAYRTETIPHAATALPPYADNGVAAMLALDNERLLVLERAFANGYGNTIRVFEVSLKGATSVLGRESIKDDTTAPLTKTLVFTLDEGTFGLDMDNIESISFGPDINGQKTLVLASDNNFNPRGQVTQFIVLGWKP